MGESYLGLLQGAWSIVDRKWGPASYFPHILIDPAYDADNESKEEPEEEPEEDPDEDPDEDPAEVPYFYYVYV